MLVVQTTVLACMPWTGESKGTLVISCVGSGKDNQPRHTVCVVYPICGKGEGGVL